MPPRNFELAVTDFAHSIGLLVRRTRAAASSNQLSWTETSVLRRLGKQGPATTAELARAQGMRPQSMRTILASLENLGMIHRTPHPTDGRQVNIELTHRGETEQKTAGDAKQNWLTQTLSQLPPSDQETLFAAGNILKRLLESPPQ